MMLKRKILLVPAILLIIGVFLAPSSISAFQPAAPPWLWSDIEEGQQIAVITMRDSETAEIDMFISLRDRTKESHEITFFMPIGKESTGFYAVEQDILSFDRTHTESLDTILERGARQNYQALHALFSGALIANGAVAIPFWSPLLIAGCSVPEPEPRTVFQTESTGISIYDVEDDVDLDALIESAGLDQSAIESLEKFRGQQIAIVKLKTNPESAAESDGTSWSSEPGVHISWTTKMIPSDQGTTYTYPLATGAAWSKPIELTRVYVVAPVGISFDVDYPFLGSEQSGYEVYGGPLIDDYHQVPAYAIDDAIGDFGRVWRATYTQSNPSRDLIVTAGAQTSWDKFRAAVSDSAVTTSFIVALILGIAFWLLAWRYLMPRFLGVDYKQTPRLQWYFALIYPGVSTILIIFPGSILYGLFAAGLAVQTLIPLFLIFAAASVGAFFIFHARRLGVSSSKAFGAFILVSLVSNIVYLIVAFGYAKLSGIL